MPGPERARSSMLVRAMTARPLADSESDSESDSDLRRKNPSATGRRHGGACEVRHCQKAQYANIPAKGSACGVQVATKWPRPP
jgi:hypothetical protein